MCPYFYPRSPCGERPGTMPWACCTVGISIHALLAESDGVPSFSVYSITGISIHALLAESDVWPAKTCTMSKPFLSTLSLRRATIMVWGLPSMSVHFYPRSPCGERLHEGLPAACPMRISIHALLAESDSKSAQNSGALLRI